MPVTHKQPNVRVNIVPPGANWHNRSGAVGPARPGGDALVTFEDELAGGDNVEGAASDEATNMFDNRGACDDVVDGDDVQGSRSVDPLPHGPDGELLPATCDDMVDWDSGLANSDIVVDWQVFVLEGAAERDAAFVEEIFGGSTKSRTSSPECAATPDARDAAATSPLPTGMTCFGSPTRLAAAEASASAESSAPAPKGANEAALQELEEAAVENRPPQPTSGRKRARGSSSNATQPSTSSPRRGTGVHETR
jgi:hypothetical protein